MAVIWCCSPCVSSSLSSKHEALTEKSSGWSETYATAIHSYDGVQHETQALQATLRDTKETLTSLPVTPRLKDAAQQQHTVR